MCCVCFLIDNEAPTLNKQTKHSKVSEPLYDFILSTEKNTEYNRNKKDALIQNATTSMYVHMFREIKKYIKECAKHALIQSLHICVWSVCGGLKGPIETIALQEFIIEQMRDFVSDFQLYAWYKVIAIFTFYVCGEFAMF